LAPDGDRDEVGVVEGESEPLELDVERSLDVRGTDDEQRGDEEVADEIREETERNPASAKRREGVRL
jgi:hypothetical protein